MTDARSDVVASRVEHLGRPSLLRMESLAAERERYRERFRSASPFPHVVIDDVLAFAPSRLDAFPSPDWPHWKTLGDTYQHEKYFSNALDVIPEPWRELLLELSMPEFLGFLEAVTGIEKLLPDPYLTGGGLHLSTAGGILAPHTDFHVYSSLDLYRRLNVLIYLNPDWSVGDGGELILETPGRRRDRLEIPPVWGRMVVFQTDDRSVHGFTNPVRESTQRRSVAAYYYTAAPTRSFSGDATTHFRSHGAVEGVEKARYAASRVLMQISRAFSLLAHLANPKQGIRWWKARSANQAQRKQA